MVILTSVFCLGWVLVFLSRVKLALRKDAFVCSTCGNCCRLRFIELTLKNVERIQAKGHKNFYDEIKNEFVMKRNNGKCIFLNQDNSCSIYEIRPEVCRDFPFFKKFGLVYCRSASYCPGVDELKKNA